MYKMLVLDMDGTLLNEEQKISKRNKEAIQKAINKGVKVVLASGRPIKGLIPYHQELGLDKEGEYSVACSGAIALDNKRHKIIQEYTMPHEDIISILEFCREHELDMNVYTKEEILVHEDNLFSRYDAIANNTPLKHVDFYKLSKDEEFFKVSVINESLENKDDIVSYFPTFQIESLEMREKNMFNPNFLTELWRFPEELKEKYMIVQPLPFSLEVFDKKCNKAVGVKAISDLFGINQSEIICIGDSGNDVHMIEYAGLGVAMENASEDVKKIANEITKSNTDDGVAFIIEKYLL